jgi:hypothetical protein
MDYLYYYGLLIVKHTVICIFKNNPDIAVTPADVNIIINYSIFNVENKFDEDGGARESELFTEVCLPGMTEDFRLPVFIKYYNDEEGKEKKLNFGVKMVYVCEEASEAV